MYRLLRGDSLARAASSQDDELEAKIKKPASFAASAANCNPGPACPRAYITLECPWNTIFTLWKGGMAAGSSGYQQIKGLSPTVLLLSQVKTTSNETHILFVKLYATIHITNSQLWLSFPVGIAVAWQSWEMCKKAQAVGRVQPKDGARKCDDLGFAGFDFCRETSAIWDWGYGWSPGSSGRGKHSFLHSLIALFFHLAHVN